MLVLFLNLFYIAQLLHKCIVSVFLCWFYRLGAGPTAQGTVHSCLCSEPPQEGKASQLLQACRVAVPALPSDENWLSEATVLPVRSGPIRVPREGAGLKGTRCAAWCLCGYVRHGGNLCQVCVSENQQNPLATGTSGEPADHGDLRYGLLGQWGIPSLGWEVPACFPGTAPLPPGARNLSPSSPLPFSFPGAARFGLGCPVRQSHRWCA